MSKEPSSFALLYPEFNKQFPDDIACVDYLFEEGWNKDKPCSFCGSLELSETTSFRVRECKSCGAENWIFAGTFLERIRRIRAWFAGLWFSKMGVRFSCSEFARYLGVSPDTAERISKTIALNLLDLMDFLPTVSSAEFMEIFARRSTETPAREHPRVEQDEIEASSLLPEVSEQADFVNDSNALSEQEKCVLDQLELERFSTIDTLVELTQLDFSDLVQIVSLLEIKGFIESSMGQQFRLCKKKRVASGNLSDSSQSVVLGFMGDVKRVPQRISRKYVQLHLALYWSATQRDVWDKHDLIFRILDKESASRKELRDYISPQQVRIPIDSLAI